MKHRISVRHNFRFDLCVDAEVDPHSMIRYELHLVWGVNGYMASPEEILVLNAESQLCLDFDGVIMAGIPVRFRSPNLIIGRRPHPRKIRVTAHGSGGNMYCESYTIARRSAPHLLNLLRRHTSCNATRKRPIPVFGFSEWDTDFIDRIWYRRQSLTEEALRAWSSKVILGRLESPDHKPAFKTWLSTLNSQPSTPA